MKHVALVLAFALALPASAQPKDVPCAAEPGDVILKPEVAVSTAKRLAAAEAKVNAYEAHPPMPAWAVVVLVLGGVAAGVAGSIVVYEVTKRP